MHGNLRLLQLDCAGSEQYTADGLLAKDCQLCNASGSFGLAISEYLICTILMLMRNMNLYIRNQEAGVLAYGRTCTVDLRIYGFDSRNR